MITSPTHLLGWHSCATFEYVETEGEKLRAVTRADLIRAAEGDELAARRVRWLPHFKGIPFLSLDGLRAAPYEHAPYEGTALVGDGPSVVRLFWNELDSPFVALLEACAALALHEADECLIVHYGEGGPFTTVYTLEECHDALDEMTQAEEVVAGAYCGTCARCESCPAATNFRRSRA